MSSPGWQLHFNPPPKKKNEKEEKEKGETLAEEK